MEKQKLEGLVKAHLLKCQGVRSADDRSPVLDKKEAVQVVVKVYKDGKSTPLCNFAYENGSGAILCTASRVNQTYNEFKDKARTEFVPLCPFASYK